MRVSPHWGGGGARDCKEGEGGCPTADRGYDRQQIQTPTGVAVVWRWGSAVLERASERASEESPVTGNPTSLTPREGRPCIYGRGVS